MSKRRFLISPLAAAATLLAFGAQAQVTVQGFADGAWRSVSNSKGTVQSVVSGSGTGAPNSSVTGPPSDPSTATVPAPSGRTP